MNALHAARPGSNLEIEVRHLRLVVAIAEEGSVTRAGQRLFLTQSALSHQLGDLEERLGVQLFSRKNRQLVLTSAGKKFLESARDVVGRLHVLQGELAVMAGKDTGVVRVSTECHTCYHWLPNLLTKFGRVYPNVEIEIDVSATSRPLKALSEGVIDLALAFSEAENGQFVSRHLFEDEVVAVVAANHPYAKKTHLEAQDFVCQTVIAYSYSKEDLLLFRRVLTPAGVEPSRILNPQLTEAIIELVAAGLGIGVLSKWAVERQLASGQLVALGITSEGMVRTWRSVHRKDKFMPEYLKTLIDMLHAETIRPKRA